MEETLFVTLFFLFIVQGAVQNTHLLLDKCLLTTIDPDLLWLWYFGKIFNFFSFNKASISCSFLELDVSVVYEESLVIGIASFVDFAFSTGGFGLATGPCTVLVPIALRI